MNNSTMIHESPDGRVYDPRAVRQITQQWIDVHMKEREVEFTKSANCTIFCGTWNVNAKKQEGSLSDWLLPPSDDRVKAADIYAVGFQEIVDLNAMNVALNSNNTQQRAQFWQEKISESLDTISGYRYKLVADKYLVGLYLVIYVKEALYHQITDVRATTLGCGIMGMLGNKGGVSIRLSFYDSGIVFVCSHLAAHRENVIGRNNDYKNIYEKSAFPPENTNNSMDGSGHKTSSANASASTSNNTNINTNHHQGVNYNHQNQLREETIETFNHQITTNYIHEFNNIVMPRQGAIRFLEDTLSVSDHDIVIWFGDLNYRIDDSLTTEEVFKAIEENNLEILRQRDQLNIQRKQQKAFIGFEEGVINFQPTYKYQPGTDLYETRAEKKLRAPAWCDRILWKTKSTTSSTNTNNFNQVALLAYNRSNLLPSDHKPVFAQLNCQLKQIVASKERAIFQELMTQLQTYNKGSSSSSSTVTTIPPPVVQLSELKINLGKVYFDVKQETVITMQNTGESIVHWHFVPKLDDLPHVVSKRWISIDVLSGLLLPGESVNIQLTIAIDKYTAQALNAGKDLLQDVLILRIERSTDKFVEITGDYERSCYGVALEELVTMLEPVANTQLPVVRVSSGNISSNPNSSQNSTTNSQTDLLSMDNANANTNGAANTTANSTTKLSIPKELWRLVDILYASDAIKEKDLFNTLADTKEVFLVRQALDQGTDFPSTISPHAVIEALLTWLAALPKPLIPADLCPAAEIDPATIRAASRKFLEDLPPLNYNVFVYILSFLREVLAEDSYNRTNPIMLSTICVQNMTYSVSSANASSADSNDTNDNMTTTTSTRKLTSSVSSHSSIHGNNTIANGNANIIVSPSWAEDNSAYLQVMSKDEIQKRNNRQIYLQDILLFLLTTTSL